MVLKLEEEIASKEAEVALNRGGNEEGKSGRGDDNEDGSKYDNENSSALLMAVNKVKVVTSIAMETSNMEFMRDRTRER